MNDVVLTLPRRIIPRWRDFATTAALGEIDPVRPSAPPQALPTDLVRIKEIWTKFKSPLTAGELLAAGLIEKDWDAVVSAATYLMRDDVEAPAFSREVAKHALQWSNAGESFPTNPSTAETAILFDKRIIGAIRRSLRNFQHDPIHWIELALGYAIIGKHDKAYRAVMAAIQLAPNDRFVLRCASRFLVHRQQFDRAADLIGRASRTPTDSWLLAAHIAVSEILEKPSRFYRRAKEAFASSDISPLHLSELGTALATAELYAGNDKHAKRLFRAALVSPTENALAQALWAQNYLVIEQSNNLLKLPRTFEANARVLVQTEQWDNALKATHCWHEDEPFSARPAMLGSFIAASAQQDFKLAEQIAKRGLIANPHNPTLRNNLAFAQGCAGQVKAAVSTLGQVRVDEPTAQQRVALTATAGLIAFRSGDPELGRQRYLEAMQLAKSEELQLEISLVAIHLAREELRADSLHLSDSLSIVREALTDFSAPSVRLALSKLNEDLKTKSHLPLAAPEKKPHRTNFQPALIKS